MEYIMSVNERNRKLQVVYFIMLTAIVVLAGCGKIIGNPLIGTYVSTDSSDVTIEFTADGKVITTFAGVEEGTEASITQTYRVEDDIHVIMKGSAGQTEYVYKLEGEKLTISTLDDQIILQLERQ